jgi:hypothetical protein
LSDAPPSEAPAAPPARRGGGRRAAAPKPETAPVADPAPVVREPVPPKPAPKPARSGPAFGAGVIGSETPPPPAPKSSVAPDVKPTVEVEGRRKAPVTPPKPPADGGFGVGL